MTVKEFLNQAHRLDQRINSKLDQIDSLHALATKATVTYSDMPRNPNKGRSKVEDIVIKIMELEEEINKDIDRLVDLKTNITHMIKMLDNHEHQILLEQRYLCFQSWEQISVDLGYSIQHTYRLHDEALTELSRFYKDESK